ncbi:right-handed parallel beta-helix repeat-containing protein [Shewanella sp. NR704-98]|uniref:Right-handed parallel beta-helix repeat-containing protein n=1 Tax=Shewanella nanhaiensis TaxID=2864872 RepID=A0ABS7E3P9_9GAMM|nr:right-handed parallel beta-helix repeat-containing protein [Shewanella nanhaiensis]
MKSIVPLVVILFCLFFTSFSKATQVIHLSPSAQDMTPVLAKALASVTESELKIVLDKGIYHFKPDYAKSGYRVITNHGNGVKKVIFSLEGFDSVEIEGNGAELVFHGQLAPFQFYRNNKVRVSDLSIDWDIPFTFTSEVLAVNSEQGWIDIKPLPGNSYQVKNGQLLFPNVDGFNYEYLGSSLAFEPVQKRVVHGAWDFKSKPDRVQKRENGVLRIHEKLKYYPPVGSWLNSKGDRHNDRYAPVFQVRNSKDIRFDGVKVHHALGMGFLFERSENIEILNSGVLLKDKRNGTRVISSTADATHFANCKGDILIENSRFENMLDDGVNVHGTYVMVESLLSDKSVRVELKHFEQQGFEFAAKGDEVWFVHQPDVHRRTVNEVTGVNRVNERFIELSFKDSLPSQLQVGDLLENKTWNPNFTMRGNSIGDHRARSIVLKTPKEILIEDNHLYSMMSCIFMRGESFYWYESGAVEDVTIRNNVFENCAYSGKEHAVMYITPRLGKSFDSTQFFDSNIRFINNSVTTFDNRIIWADRVDGLIIEGNKIAKVVDETKPPLHPSSPVFEFTNSKNVELKGNRYIGDKKQLIKADRRSSETLKYDGSMGTK